MPINAFKRINNYFDGFVKVRANSIDLQFNILSNYLNTNVYPVLEQLASDKIVGSTNPADINKFMQNVGDTTTRWAAINNDAFTDYNLSLTKLSKLNKGSVIAANSSGELTGIAPTENAQVLVSRTNNTPIWQKLTASNIANRGITGDSVAEGTITNANLPAYLIETLIADNSITGDKFQDNSITSSKIADTTLEAGKLSPGLAAEFASTVWSNIIPDNHLTTVGTTIRPLPNSQIDYDTVIRLFNNQALPVAKYNTNGKPAINTTFPASKFSTTANSGQFFGFSPYHVYGQVNSATKLKDASIEAGRVAIGYKISSAASPDDFRAYVRRNMSQMVAEEAVELQHLTPYLRAKFEGARAC